MGDPDYATKPSAAKQATGAKPGPKPDPGSLKSRLIPATTEHDFDEQVIGSHQRTRIIAPTNVSDWEAFATFTVAGAGFRLVNNPGMTLPSASRMTAADAETIYASSPMIVYEPTEVRHHRGTLTIEVEWGDGTRERQTVVLLGRARALDHAPSHEPTAAETQQNEAHKKRMDEEKAHNKQAQHEDEKNGPALMRADFDEGNGAVPRAHIAAEALGKAQKRGFNVIAQEAGAYRKQAQGIDRSIWWDLAEVALTMATAGIASHLAKNVLPRLLSASTDKVLAVHGTETFAHVLLTSPAKFSEFTTDALKEGFKTAGKAAIKKAHDEGGAGQTSSQGPSTNARIAFFDVQDHVLDDQTSNTRTEVGIRADELRPLLRTDPGHAIALMQGMTDGFHATAATAEEIQKNTLAPQWATFVARMSLGTESVSTAQPASREAALVTQTEPLRAQKETGLPKAVDGVLEVYVLNEYPPAKVQRVRLHGSSFAMADRLAAVPLLDAKMPIRFVLGTNNVHPSIVTRDESGRVRVTGDYANIAKYSGESSLATTEADAIAGATVMVEQILSRPLASWGVEITTDDATPRTGVGQ